MSTKTTCFIQLAGSFLLCFFCSVTHGQDRNEMLTKIYFQAAGGFTNHMGSSEDLSVQGILKDRWAVTLSYQKVNMEAKNLPKDYQPGSGTVFFLPVTDATPGFDMKTFNITAGRYFKTGRNTWFTTEGGLSVSSGKKLTFTKSSVSEPEYNFGILFGITGTSSNYTFTEEKKTGIGAVLKADFNWAFASFIGMGVGAFANFNSMQSPIGFQLKLIVGKLNREKRER